MASSSERELYNIRKFDGTNFSLWKEQIQDVLVQKKQLKPISGPAAKPAEMSEADWLELDALAKSTIRLHLAESVYFTVVSETTSHNLWKKLCSTYEKETASNKVYLMKRLFELQMKEGTSVAAHLNEFNIIFSQMQAQKLDFQDEVKAIFLLCSLPASWDTFRTAISNSAPDGTLTFNDVVGSLLSEEIRRKSMDQGKNGQALSTQDDRGRKQYKEKNQDRGKSRSKSRSKQDIECYCCGKTGHFKKDCFKWKRMQKKKDGKGGDKKDDKGKGKEKVEEVNVVTYKDDGEVLFTSSLPADILVAADQELGQEWILDSGASFHVTPHRSWFSTYDDSRRGSVHLGNDYVCDIVGAGDVLFTFPSGSTFTLKNVRHVPKLTKSLISTGQLDDLGYATTFGSQSWRINKGSLIIARGAKCGTLYPIHVSFVHNHVIAVTELPSASLWHSRLAHMSLKGMETLSRLGYLPVLNFSNFSVCEHCIYGKHARSAHKRNANKKKSEPLDLVHSDVCGPMPVRSLGGASYFITFIDDATRKLWVYPMARKDDAFQCFQKFLALVENMSGKKLKCLRTDNGGEYVSHEFKSFCEMRGIKRELTAPGNPAQNGVAERMNRTINERVLSMLSNAGLTQGFWAEAMVTAVHLINRSPNSTLDGGVPEEAWSGKKPSYDHLRVFGCEAYVHVPRDKRSKLEPKSRKCIFMGYGESGEMGYRLWDPKARKMVCSSDVIFNEKKMHKQPLKEMETRKVSFQDVVPPVILPRRANVSSPSVQREGSSSDHASQQEGRTSGSPVQSQMVPSDRVEAEIPTQEEPVVLRRSTRVSHPPERFVPGLDYVMLTDCGEPSCYKEAMSRDDKLKWERAMESEMDSIDKNQTWELVPLPKGKNALPCKWVYKLKVTSDNSKPKYKARLVAKGFKQEKGVDFDEIFSPVVKMTTLCTVLALVAKEDMDLVQLDVKTTFLHGDLHDEIYMQQPEGFAEKGKEKLVCKLKKSLYGLKQAPREWYNKFDAFMQSHSYTRSETDHCLYTKKAKDGSLMVLILYVDDMLIAGKNGYEIDALKKRLMDAFEMKDLGDANHILGMRITRDRTQRLLYLSQKDYVCKVLQRFNMEGGKAISTPLPPYVKLGAKDSLKSDVEKAEMAKVPYASCVGSLMYAMIATRPDIAFAVGVVSRYMSDPGKKHWEAVKGILRYLSGTKEMCICFGKSNSGVLGYTDSDYAGNADNRRSTTGYVFTLYGGAVSWMSRLQKCVALSTTEAEYVAATEACKEALWLIRLVGDLGLGGDMPVLHSDSQSAIMLAKNPVFHAKTKHIEVKYHFLRQVLEDKQLEMVKVHTDDNPADFLTKSLPSEKFAHCRELMGIG